MADTLRNISLAKRERLLFDLLSQNEQKEKISSDALINKKFGSRSLFESSLCHTLFSVNEIKRFIKLELTPSPFLQNLIYQKRLWGEEELRKACEDQALLNRSTPLIDYLKNLNPTEQSDILLAWLNKSDFEQSASVLKYFFNYLNVGAYQALLNTMIKLSTTQEYSVFKKVIGHIFLNEIKIPNLDIPQTDFYCLMGAY